LHFAGRFKENGNNMGHPLEDSRSRGTGEAHSFDILMGGNTLMVAEKVE
jgi:hypothetical protein